MATIYQTLEKNRKRRPGFERTQEFSFYLRHADILNKVNRFDFLKNKENSDFDIMRANIVIQAYQNKEYIDEEIKSLYAYLSNDKKLDRVKFISALKERCVDLPYYSLDKDKIYIPIFTQSINLVYTKTPEKMMEYPYSNLFDNFNDSVVDMFDVYGFELYDSYFTRLIKVGSSETEGAFFHYDTNTIYIINDQGRLDNKIVLFDKYMKRISTNHMLERLRPVAQKYFENNRDEFIGELYKNEFISGKMYAILKELHFKDGK